MASQLHPAAAKGILVVDDDPDVRMIVSEYLEYRGYSVLQASDGTEALEIIEDHPNLRLIISDVRMRQMSGLELAERVAADYPAISVILISGYFQAQAIGPRFLKKPFSMQQLDSAVQAELTGKHV